MDSAVRHTIIAHSLLRMRELRLEAARGRRHGLQIMTVEQLAARPAGGLVRSVGDDALREAITAVLPETALGELDGIKAMPGMVRAAADTLRKAWRTDVELQARAGEHPRLRSIASLEAAVMKALPPAMMRPAYLVAADRDRLEERRGLTPETLEHYRARVRSCLDMTFTERGLIVAMSSKTVIPVTRRRLTSPMPRPHFAQELA